MALGAHISFKAPRTSSRVMKPPAVRIPQTRRDYSKQAEGAENPLAAPPRQTGFAGTGLAPGEQE